MWNWIKNLFKKKEEPKKDIPKPVEPKPVEPTPIPKPSNKLKIAIVLGHGSTDPGAFGHGTNEVEYNTWVMKEIEKLNLPNVKCFYGKNSMDGVLKSLSYLPELTIQLHLNSAGPTAQGCEVLVIKGDVKSYQFAEKFANDLCKRFSRKLRGNNGKKELTSADRGYASLKACLVGAKILVEPFFLSNPDEKISKEEYLEFITKYIKDLE